MALQADNIFLQKSDKDILSSVSLACEPGQILALCGANGAGKSSLLNVLCGDEHRYQGRVTLEGIDLRKLPLRDMAQKRAVMPQKVNMAFAFPVTDVIAMGLREKTDHAQQSAIIAQVAELFDLHALLSSCYLHLSGGQQQRVQLARVVAQLLQPALVGQPRYLLLDECTSSMDIAMQHRVFACLQQLCDDNIGVVAVVHDLNLAARYADYIMLLKEGHAAAYGSAATVINTQSIQYCFDIGMTVLQHPVHGCPVLI